MFFIPDCNDTEPIPDDVQWLMQNSNSTSDILEKWNNTFKQRGKCENIEYYWNKFKCLHSKIGHTLVSFSNCALIFLLILNVIFNTPYIF